MRESEPKGPYVLELRVHETTADLGEIERACHVLGWELVRVEGRDGEGWYRATVHTRYRSVARVVESEAGKQT